MRSSDLFGLSLLFLLDFWRPAEGLCSLENGRIARCHYLEDSKYIVTYNLHTLRASAAEKILTPASFRNLTTLRHLDLSGGDLEEIYPGSFLQLPHLLSLNLAENHIKDLNSSSLKGLKNLQILSLKKNNIHHIPEALLDLKSLKVLDVSRNQLDCNCATLKVRDKLVERGVRILKRALCSGPVGMKGWSLLKPSSKLVCLFEEQDEGMQMDQPVVEGAEGSGELGSGDEELFEDDEGDLEEDADTPVKVPEIAETPAPETPAPEASEAVTSASKTTVPKVLAPEIPEPKAPVEATQPTPKEEGSITSVSPVEVSLEKNKLEGDDGLFFDTDEKSSTENPAVRQTENPTRNDFLVFPVEGSGDDDEFEGSGTIVPPIDFKESVDETVFEKTSTDDDKQSEGTGSLFDNIFGSFSDKTSTTAPEQKTESEIVDEEFLPVVTIKTSEAGEMLPKSITPDVIQFKENGTLTKNGETKQEIADASSQDTKMGNGSMVVLIVLLGIFIALVGLAAYKGDFCKKKRVPDDMERGTELKEMRKSLLEGGNSVQPKISNGNTESVPLIKAPLQTESKEKESSNQNGNSVVDGTPSAKLEPPAPSKPSAPSTPSAPTAPEILDPVKPPRKSIPQEEVGRPATNGKSNQEPYINPETKFRNPLNLTLNDTKTPPNTPMIPMNFGNPPLSPDAQRVKIILQDNPDSVPKTPILITRTKMGENLVKTP